MGVEHRRRRHALPDPGHLQGDARQRADRPRRPRGLDRHLARHAVQPARRRRPSRERPHRQPLHGQRGPPRPTPCRCRPRTGKLRFWRNTTSPTLAPGDGRARSRPERSATSGTATSTTGSRPAGLIDMSNDHARRVATTSCSTTARRTATASPPTALTLYRAASGALVFGAGTVQWAWGLDVDHDRGSARRPTSRMQQATVNLFADMGVQPATVQAPAHAGDASRPTRPRRPRPSPARPTASSARSAAITVSGTATDSGGGRVGGVEVSVDGGASWHPAYGRENWTYTFNPPTVGTLSIKSRAADDSVNLETLGRAFRSRSRPRVPVHPLGLLGDSAESGRRPTPPSVELGVKFQSDIDGLDHRRPVLQGRRQRRNARRQPLDRDRHAARLGDVHERDRNRLAGGDLPQPRADRGQHHLRRVLLRSQWPLRGRHPLLRRTARWTTLRCTRSRTRSSPNGVFGYSGPAPSRRAPSSRRTTTSIRSSGRGPVDTTRSGGAVTTSPAPGATGCRPCSVTPNATYNEPVQPATVSFVLTKAGELTVPANLSYDAASRTSRLAPLVTARDLDAYTATVSGATDLAGNAIRAARRPGRSRRARPAPPPQISLWDVLGHPVNPSVD